MAFITHSMKLCYNRLCFFYVFEPQGCRESSEIEYSFVKSNRVSETVRPVSVYTRACSMQFMLREYDCSYSTTDKRY